MTESGTAELQRKANVVRLSKIRRKALVGRNMKHLRNPLRRGLDKAASKKQLPQHSYKGFKGVMKGSSKQFVDLVESDGESAEEDQVSAKTMPFQKKIFEEHLKDPNCYADFL